MAVLYTQSPAQFFDDDGNPLAGGKIYTYEAGTTTPKATYTDDGEGTELDNPIILDGAGRAQIWINGSYKFVIHDANDNPIDTVDNVTSFSTSATNIDSILPSQTGNSGKALMTNGTTASWSDPAGTQQSIASASTTSIAGYPNALITGTTTITSFGTSGTTGKIYQLRFASALSITYNATSLITPTATNISIKAGQTITVEDLGSNNWRVREMPTPIVTDWVAYTPTITGFGSPTSVSFFSRRVGDTLEIRGRFTAGTTTAAEARVSMGYNGTDGNVTSDSTKLPSSASSAGTCVTTSTGTGINPSALIEPSVTYLTMGLQAASSGGLTKANGNAITSSGNGMSLFASVPISGW